MAMVMPGVTIGDRAFIAANAFLVKGTVVGPDEIWGGIPAKKLGSRSKRGEPTAAAAVAAASAAAEVP
jgi:acetyltransferase-like isoleucine patch superfamily enzyme